MNLLKQAQEFEERTKTLEAQNVYELLLKINRSPYHYLATKDMTPKELEFAEIAQTYNYIELIPANHSAVLEKPEHYSPRKHVPTRRDLPERYVLLAAGSHTLNSFIDTMNEDRREYRRKYRK